MLIEFTVENFRSIKERQTFSMVSSTSKELRDTNTMSILNDKQSLVRSAVIYGPNAAGKSNLIKALKTMKQIVLESAQGQRGDKLPVTPYLFDPSTRTMPTSFSITIICHEVRYDYGFTATAERIVEEWLLAYPKGRAQSWIDRRYNPTTEQYAWGNTEKLVGARQLWQETTRPNALFLSTAIQLNNTQLQPVFDWFASTVHFLDSQDTPAFSMKLVNSPARKHELLTFLQSADLEILDLEIQQENVPTDGDPVTLAADLQKHVPDRLSGRETVTVQTRHRGPNGQQFLLDMAEESEGTKTVFAFAGPWLDALRNGLVLVVDEIDNSLHPLLVKYLITLFHNQHRNQNSAQLILTTHETAILRQDLFRRDQVWFVDKDEYNATTLYPLSDFSPRKGVENIENGYLQGRYGALPYFRNIQQMMDVAHG